jgi:hypothetical protein
MPPLGLGRIVLVLLLLGAQRGPSHKPPEEDSEVVLPNGKSQRREILKADFEKSKADSAELVELAQQLKDDFEKEDYHVLNLRTLKKAEDAEKLARRIKERMKRHL